MNHRFKTLLLCLVAGWQMAGAQDFETYFTDQTLRID